MERLAAASNTVPGKPVTVSMKNGRTTTDCIVVPEDGDLCRARRGDAPSAGAVSRASGRSSDQDSDLR